MCVISEVTFSFCTADAASAALRRPCDHHGIGERCFTASASGASQPSTFACHSGKRVGSVTYANIDGPIRAIVDVNVEPLVDNRSSRLTIDLGFTGHGIGKLLVPLFVRRQARTEMSANLRRLKERMETRR